MNGGESLPCVLDSIIERGECQLYPLALRLKVFVGLSGARGVEWKDGCGASARRALGVEDAD